MPTERLGSRPPSPQPQSTHRTSVERQQAPRAQATPAPAPAPAASAPAAPSDQYATYKPADQEALTQAHLQPKFTQTVGENPYARPNRPSLYGRKDPDPKHVRQGNVGDCHVLASMAGVASNPDAIKQMVQPTGEGTYQVNLHDPNTLNPVTVHVDDKLPTDYEASFHQSKGQNVIWPHVAEKAYAKLNDASTSVKHNEETDSRMISGYGGLQGGTGIGAMQALTGKPADFKLLKNMSDAELKGHLNKANQAGTPVVAGSQFDETKEMEKAKIQSRHAYTVVGTRETPQGTMVQVRDPHGGTQRPLLGTGKDVIEMPLAQFKRNFESLTFLK